MQDLQRGIRCPPAVAVGPEDGRRERLPLAALALPDPGIRRDEDPAFPILGEGTRGEQASAWKGNGFPPFVLELSHAPGCACQHATIRSHEDLKNVVRGKPVRSPILGPLAIAQPGQPSASRRARPRFAGEPQCSIRRLGHAADAFAGEVAWLAAGFEAAVLEDSNPLIGPDPDLPVPAHEDVADEVRGQAIGHPEMCPLVPVVPPDAVPGSDPDGAVRGYRCRGDVAALAEGIRREIADAPAGSGFDGGHRDPGLGDCRDRSQSQPKKEGDEGGRPGATRRIGGLVHGGGTCPNPGNLPYPFLGTQSAQCMHRFRDWVQRHSAVAGVGGLLRLSDQEDPALIAAWLSFRALVCGTM